MWRSVPQIPVFRTWMRTSFGPTSGTGTSWSESPGSGRAFTSAFMRPSVRTPYTALGLERSDDLAAQRFVGEGTAPCGQVVGHVLRVRGGRDRGGHRRVRQDP